MKKPKYKQLKAYQIKDNNILQMVTKAVIQGDMIKAPKENDILPHPKG